MRALLPVLLLAGSLQAAELPAWWAAMKSLPRLESGFVQASESAVFGSLKKEGSLQLSKGGRFRITYDKGLLLLSDGRVLIQYDASARTAQRLELKKAAQDMPLLNVLVDPEAVETSYDAKPEGPDGVRLEPRRKGLPAVTLKGNAGFLRRVQWTDATGAQQTLDLKDPHIPKAPYPLSTFIFSPPKGTRWLGAD